MEPNSEPKERSAENVEIDPRVLEILVCPVSGGPLRYEKDTHELISKKAGLAYPVRQGVPIMLADEARKLTD